MRIAMRRRPSGASRDRAGVPGRALGLGLGLGFAVGLVATLAVAMEPPPPPDSAEVKAGKRVFATVAVCADCHGWAGDGVGNPRAPRGPSLRATQLTRDQILEVVKCGRPGTAMPHHDRNAYTDKRCYDATAEDLGDQTPPAGKPLSDKQLANLMEYLMAKVVGRGEPTHQECEDYFGKGAGACRTLTN